MSAFLIEDIVAATGGELLFGDPRAACCGLSTDTRKVASGELFVALSGPRFDGNSFAEAAIEAGAAALILRREDSLAARFAGAGVAIIVHDDPRAALGALARWHRRRLGLPVVGITGSCGKTTTKNYLVKLLSRVRRTVGSPLSYNNNVGVPLTLLAADASTEVLCCEMGSSGPGEIAELSSLVLPDIGVITGVGASHLEGLGSLEGVAIEKNELARALPKSGLLVVHDDGRFRDLFVSSTEAEVVTFGIDNGQRSDADLVATKLCFDGGRSVFELRGKGLEHLEGREVTLPALGTHNVLNLLAALAVCRGLGIDLEEVLPAVAEIEGQSGRLESFELDGLVVIDDTYNANPESASAAVRVLAGIHGHTRRVLVLGDMLELGDFAVEMHHALGRAAAAAGIDKLVLVGELARAAEAGALEGGMQPAEVSHFTTRRAAEEALEGLFRKGDLVLVKASRGMRLEAFVRKLRERFAVGEKRGSGGRGAALACFAGWEVA
jgi:UDP-N-acetylmuramoyl-tripeptide--D-alanyl-D-alanine ligase